MEDPLKIIWKFKNNNRRTQYHIYIFVGPVSKDISTILDKISELSFYDTLVGIHKTEYKKMETQYGQKWYMLFFNTYHINSSVYLIRDSSSQKQELIEKYGKEWYDTHIESFNLVERKLIYSYEALIKDERLRKTIKKGRSTAIIEEEIDIDYSTSKKLDLLKLFNTNKGVQRSKVTSDVPITIKNNDKYDDTPSSDDMTDSSPDDRQVGGFDETDDDVGENDDADEMDATDDFGNDELESNELLSDEEVDIDEIEQIYKDADVNPDSNVSETTNMIKKALNDDKLFDKKTSDIVIFDQSKDTNMYDENLKDIYKKYYVKSQFIFKDDTIKVMKDKICCGMKNNAKFDKESYLLPSRQYLWTEYFYDNKIEKIMLGQKWMKRNELLNIDIEPNNNFRIYEELRGQLKLLKENIRRYNNKIRREDDDNNIIYDYEGYMANNEIYLIDLYNELGTGYQADADTIRNLHDIYIKIYFPRIKTDDLKYIIDYLGGDKKAEISKINTVFETINNDLILENEIANMIETVRTQEKFQYIFKENYITQSVIHVNLRIKEPNKIDLFRIFNEFDVNSVYPFIQYQTPDGAIAYKFNEKEINGYLKHEENTDVLTKWFENAPYGISVKVKITDKIGDKFMAINLNDNGRIEYKTQWKEEDMATIDDIKNTYAYVKNLITKINEEKNKVSIEIPDDSEFSYAFINTIQKFELPNDFVINHNDLSEFSRYFFPHVALVIDPRKRQAKVQKDIDKSKFGTYLRYKRVSKYENQARIEQRIMYFIRNFEFTEQTLGNEISKQFNITIAKALEEYEKVKTRYPNLKKSRKVLKKLENIPKYKPPGIGIDIQGKQREKYKVRISGARNKAQLSRIITFMNILIYLYVDTYLFKKPERQILKEKLKKLTNIAKRRSKVDDIVDYSKELKTVKQMTQVDKRRIGFKPEKGQNQWTRSCQNSGDDKKRRPQQYNSNNMEELIKNGYHLNKKTGQYEKKVVYKEKNGKKTEAIIKTVKLADFDEEGNLTGNEIHYACDPAENGDHFYIGFLTRSMNPFGHCMPCCFKKDPMISKNKEKQEFFKKCLGHGDKEVTQNSQKLMGDKLYILQDTNKIQDGRFGFLPKYLDIYFNFMLNKQKKIKHHYLAKTDTGYFFKYGSKQDDYQFLNALSVIVDKTIDEIKDCMIKALEKDKNDQIFTSLNNGDIKTQYGDKAEYIKYIKESEYLDFNSINNLLSVPNVLTKGGIHMIIFNKRTLVIKKTFEKEKTRDDFTIICQNVENVDGLTDPTMDNIFMIKENKNYYPIVLVLKDDETTKSIDLEKMFKYKEDPQNIVYHVNDYYNKNCEGTFMGSVVYKNYSLPARTMRKYLLDLKIPDFVVKHQFVDVRNKCRLLITHNNTIIPVRPSGSLYDIPIVKNIDKFIGNYQTTFKNLETIYKKSQKKIPVSPVGVYYDEKKGGKVLVNGIMTKTNDIVIVEPIELTIKHLDDNNLSYEDKPLFDKVDKEISKGKKNFVVDDRIMEVNKDKYETESYELFRLEFSEYINKKENSPLKVKLEDIMNHKSLSKKEKADKIKLFLFRLIDKSLFEIYKKVLIKDNKISSISDDLSEVEINDDSSEQQVGGKYNKFVNIAVKRPDVIMYQVSNDRSICAANANKDQCNHNPHCHWTHSGCYMTLPRDLVIMFVNRMSEDLALNDLKAFEITRVGNYFVSDIVDHDRFTEKNNQKIIRSTSHNIKKALNEIFGKEYVPKIGRRKTNKMSEINYQQLNSANPLIDMKDMFVQKIINNNLTLFRAYVNGYYWIRNKYSDIESKNLGYYSLLQTDLANHFRSMVIDWLQDAKNKKIVDKMIKYMDIKKSSYDTVHDFTVKLAKDIPTLTNCIVELSVLSKLNKIPIVVYDDNANIVYIFDNMLQYDVHVHKELSADQKKYLKHDDHKDVINLKFSLISNKKIPDNIDVLFFK